MRTERNTQVCTRTVVYPDYLFKPEDFLTFVQSTSFSKRWDKANLEDEDMQALETLIMVDPKSSPVIPETG